MMLVIGWTPIKRDDIVLTAVGTLFLNLTVIGFGVVLHLTYCRSRPKIQPDDPGHEMAAMGKAGDNSHQTKVFLVTSKCLVPDGGFNVHQPGYYSSRWIAK